MYCHFNLNSSDAFITLVCAKCPVILLPESTLIIILLIIIVIIIFDNDIDNDNI